MSMTRTRPIQDEGGSYDVTVGNLQLQALPLDSAESPSHWLTQLFYRGHLLVSHGIRATSLAAVIATVVDRELDKEQPTPAIRAAIVNLGEARLSKPQITRDPL